VQTARLPLVLGLLVQLADIVKIDSATPPGVRKVENWHEEFRGREQD
jgi:hypothetical protein